jgi:hypothetical protein
VSHATRAEETVNAQAEYALARSSRLGCAKNVSEDERKKHALDSQIEVRLDNG